MRKLSGVDAAFLYNETAHCPQTIASVQLFALRSDETAEEFLSALRSRYAQRLSQIEYLTARLVESPFGMDHPVWVTDGNVDVDHHVEMIPVAAPGTKIELEAAVASLHEQPLDRSRPLWRTVVLTGLQNRRVACYTAMHHACVDGVGGQAEIETLLDANGAAETVGHVRPAAEPASPLDLWSASLENLGRAAIRDARRNLAAGPAWIRMAQRAADPSRGLGAAASQPPSSVLNGMIKTKRIWAAGELDFATARELGNALDCTISEVFLGVCAGALRSHLSRAGHLPEASLIAGCPVSLRRPGDTDHNNQMTMMKVDLATDTDDPRERMLVIRESSRIARAVTAEAVDLVAGDPVALGLPALMRWSAEMAERAHVAPAVPFNLVISNLPGPRNELQFEGAPMESHWPVSIPAHGLGVNITVQSYAGTLYFAITACASTLPDAGALRDDMIAAFDQLVRLTTQAPAVPKRQRRRVNQRAVTLESSAA